MYRSQWRGGAGPEEVRSCLLTFTVVGQHALSVRLLRAWALPFPPQLALWSFTAEASGPPAGEALLGLPVMLSEGDASRPGRPRRNCDYSACFRSSGTFAATVKAVREPTSEAGNCR